MKQSSEKIYSNTGNREVLKRVPDSAIHILDVGCGAGVLAGLLKERGKVVDGITISEEERSVAAQNYRDVFLYNLENGLPAEVQLRKYDCIICSHVLEHIVYPTQLLQQVFASLHNGGVLIIALPNVMHYKSRIELIKGNFPYQEAGIWDYTHVKWYTFKSAQQLLKNFGFMDIEADVSGELPFNSVIKKIAPATVRRKIFCFLKWMSRGFFGYQILVVGRKQDV